MRRFDEWIRETGLCDWPLVSGQFTWSDFRVRPICRRLDRFLCTNEWLTMGQSLRQVALPRTTSDHTPIMLDTTKVRWGPAPFRMMNTWLERKDFRVKMKDWWDLETHGVWEGYKLMRKLKAVKEEIKRWHRSFGGGKKERKEMLMGRLENLDMREGGEDWDEGMQNERREIQRELTELVVQEEREARISSKSKWIKEGDANTRFFHRLMSARQAKNTIDRLDLEEDGIVEDEQEIVERLCLYYMRLYKSEDRRWCGIEGVEWGAISMEQSARMEKPFKEEEIRKAVFECEGEKAPGPDGFTMKFFKDMWNVVKGDIMKVIAEFQEGGNIDKTVNETYICLIPKKAGSRRIKDFRPISLITSVYKIISKTLSFRLREVMDCTLAETQGAFTQNRQILDSILVANEVVEEYWRKKKRGTVVKLDFEKAYDHLEWIFLDFVLERKGFGGRWRSWIWGCISSPSYSIMVNGRPRSKFVWSRGLRQGDPLSPFLFNLVVDTLGRMVEKGMTSGVIKGMRIGREGVEVAHLQFADDTIFFLEDEGGNISNLMKIVKGFCMISGMRVNKEKSVVLGINEGEREIRRKAEEVGYKQGSWPLTYLGAPLGGNPIRSDFWEGTVRKVRNRLEGWKKAYLSRGGRMVLIQAVLRALPIYLMSTFKMPKRIAEELEKLMRDFLWEDFEGGQGVHLVNWRHITRPKEKGGLGMGNVVERNRALAAKWLWRFEEEEGRLWKKVIVSKYGPVNSWEKGLKGKGITYRSPWKFISSITREF